MGIPPQILAAIQAKQQASGATPDAPPGNPFPPKGNFGGPPDGVHTMPSKKKKKKKPAAKLTAADKKAALMRRMSKGGK
jgi:hypothetical protein